MANRITRNLIACLSRFRWPSVVKRASGDSRGSVAVEFALLVVPFFSLVFVIMESGYQLFVTSTLDHSLRVESRQLQIGAAQLAGMSADEFKNKICKRLPVMSACDNLSVDVRVVDNWMKVTDRFRSSGLSDRRLAPIGADSEFCLATDNQIVLVRTFLKLPVISGFWLVSDDASGSRGVTANHFFRVEPFGAPGGNSVKCMS